MTGNDVQVVGENILAIVMGASEWPNFKKLNAKEEDYSSNPFINSKNFVLNYFCSRNGLGIPDQNVLDLFDDEAPPYELKKENFRLSAGRQESFEQSNRYHLLLRRTWRLL